MERCCKVIALNTCSVCGLYSTQYDDNGFDKRRLKISKLNIIIFATNIPNHVYQRWGYEICLVIRSLLNLLSNNNSLSEKQNRFLFCFVFREQFTVSRKVGPGEFLYWSLQ